MTAPDMASVIAAALAAHDTWVPDTEHSAVVCDECGWAIYSKWDDPSAEQTTAQRKYAHQARAVLAAISEAGAVEWGVSFADDDEIEPQESQHAAGSLIASIRDDIEKVPDMNASDYEPMHIVTRKTFIHTTPWQRAE